MQETAEIPVRTVVNRHEEFKHPSGRIIVSREDKGLLRMTLAEGASTIGHVETVNDTLLECRGLLWAYDSLYANANNSKGLYRLRDTDGDDQFDEVKLLKATPGDVGHGRNDLALGPDGMIYSIHGDDVRLPDDYDPAGSTLRNYMDARLSGCDWDREFSNASMKLPGGYVARTDRDGQRWEVIAGGMRNPFGIAFSATAELFTYDADMEWDIGAPWYRPTRILHLVSGADFGWRIGDWPLAPLVSRQPAGPAGHRPWFAHRRAVWHRQPLSASAIAARCSSAIGRSDASWRCICRRRGRVFPPPPSHF